MCDEQTGSNPTVLAALRLPATFVLNTFDQIVPPIPHGKLEVPHRRNPVRPALGQHFDAAIIKTPEDMKLIRHGVVIARILAAESMVGHDCGEIVAVLGSLPQSKLRSSALFAVVLWRRNLQASHRRSGHWMIFQDDSRVRFCGGCCLLWASHVVRRSTSTEPSCCG
jgi:hypothetical protein